MNTTTQNTAIAAAFQTANVVASTYAYFDLIDHVDTTLIDGELKARILASLAWNLDNQAIFLARNIFIETYREQTETGTLDAFNEFMNAMNEQINADKFAPVGFNKASSFSQLVIVLNMRKHWHDMAQRHATHPYQPKSLHIMLIDDKARTVSPDTRGKLALRAKFAAGDDTQTEALILTKLIGKAESTLQQQHELRQKLIKPALHILQLAGHAAETQFDGEAPAFSELPIDLQRTLIERAGQAAERAVDDMGLSNRVSIDDYTVAIRDAAHFRKCIAAVLKAPRFNNPNDE